MTPGLPADPARNEERRVVLIVLVSIGGGAVLLFLLAAGAGLFLLLSGNGTGHVLWERMDEAPAGAGEMDTSRLNPEFLDELERAPPGEGGLIVVGVYNEFWADVHAAPSVETEEGCVAVKVRGVPVEFCEGPLI